MALPFYLAMTAGELLEDISKPRDFAFMACHFSPYGTGLTNFPEELPEDSILILNDRTPLRGHDPELIVRQLTDMAENRNLRGILLDLQRPGYKEAAELAAIVPTIAAPPAEPPPARPAATPASIPTREPREIMRPRSMRPAICRWVTCAIS